MKQLNLASPTYWWSMGSAQTERGKMLLRPVQSLSNKNSAKGKGCGVRTGMKVFLQGNADLLCIIDGDSTNIPASLKEMIPLVEDGRADVVLGSRIRGKRESGAMSLLAVASNLTVSFLLGAKFKRLFTDVQTGYWLFSREAVTRIYPLIHSTGFEIELELFVSILRKKLRVCEIPVGFRHRRGTTKFSFVLRSRTCIRIQVSLIMNLCQNLQPNGREVNRIIR